MAQPSLEKPKTQLLGNACETAKHHLKPSSGTAKNRTCGGSRTAPLEPPKKKKRAPEPQYIDKKHGAAEPGEAENAAPRQRVRNSATPLKTELRHSKKKGPAAGPKRHLWNPLRRRKAPQYIDKTHGAAEPGEAENAAPRQCMRNSATPLKSELRHSKKKVPAAGPKRHLWNPLRRRKEPQYIDKKHGAAEPGEAENAAPRQRMRNSATPLKTELRHSKKQYLRRVQNGTFGTP